MNEINRRAHFDGAAAPPPTRPTTQAADGVPRVRWTLDEFEKLVEAGVLGEGERIELIGGDLVPMSPKGSRHENVRGALLNWMMRHLPEHLLLFSEPGWRPGGEHYLEPDLLLAEARTFASNVQPAKVQLIIEIAKTNLEYDTGLKARTYATLGVREYWVVNAVTLETTVHLAPADGGYGSTRTAQFSELLTPHLVPTLAVRLGDLSLG